MTIGEKRELFARLLPRLLDAAHDLGFEVRIAELYRPPEMAAIYAAQGRGIKNSLHTLGLAVDLNLFQDGHWLDGTRPSDFDKYEQLGSRWEDMDPLCRWGGRFKSRDLGHYSITHAGVR